MALNPSNVRVAITGELYAGPLTSDAPTTSVSALDSDYTGMGYVGQDGVTEEYQDTVEEHVAWQNATIVRATTTESKAKLSFVLIETKGKVLELYHKGSTVEVVSSGQWKIDVMQPQPDERRFVFDVLDGTKHLRLYIPRGEVGERGAIVYATAEVTAYEMTITCYPDGNGLVLTKFSDDPNWGYS